VDRIDEKTGVKRKLGNLTDVIEERTGGKVNRRIIRASCWSCVVLMLALLLGLIIFWPRAPQMQFMDVTSTVATEADATPASQLPTLSDDGKMLTASLGIIVQVKVPGFISVTAKNATTQVQMTPTGSTVAVPIAKGSLFSSVSLPTGSPTNVTLPVTFSFDIPTKTSWNDTTSPWLLRDFFAACNLLSGGGGGNASTISITFSTDWQLSMGLQPNPAMKDVQGQFSCPWTPDQMTGVAAVATLLDGMVNGTSNMTTLTAQAESVKTKKKHKKTSS